MKITAVHVTPLAIPLRHETPESAWAAGLGRQIIIQIFTDTGIVGLGESFAYGVPFPLVPLPITVSSPGSETVNV